DRPQSFTHAGEPQSHDRPLLRCESHSIVSNLQAELVRVRLQFHRYRVRAAMLGHVLQRLLRYPVKGQLDLLRYFRRNTSLAKIDGERMLLAKIIEQRPQRGTQA